ncbi:MAG: alcohol dehydrogenase catalytic domain-containing protein [Gammaproteobacteria bacterium]|jgi:(R,R)-butanediol dehydrogenase/meso-butanediol dehydrogenase/diacetyl reductase|nr:alcohol dehydrogenase catalytic domain-containing protein [Gammaproteobacteria bacterium]MBP6050541.1 alcohol dehydrogenase catalytic domain-containing protein [Pseudomonadales bacterium]MBK6583389.1 alcohol dehydrogenase catalytic domain-containing protein [Gammaproteobacteria bacterium]MBK7521147.1 alcohol dehydrogenase catalytic domain-containing protein [Gammaproteobacteria bacterium]MBK7728922.1 alcohol dehydrogenase catalytic domain-containing protein [Gammaproteobacteria bacterium]
MRAAIFSAAGEPLQIEERPMPGAEPGSLVIRVRACGICASDLHASEAPGMLSPGNVLGHEYAGEVVAIGAGVNGWAIGERLTALPASPCGVCAACKAGRFVECGDMLMQGFDPRMPGAYAEYTRCMAVLAMKLPESVDLQDAATIEPLAVGLGACRSAALEPGASVLVIGAGIIGLAVAKWARFFGAGDVGISEMVPARIERARRIGADIVIDAARYADPVAEFQRITGRAPTVIFECVGRPMIQKLIDMAPPGAHLVMVGTGMQPEQLTVVTAALKRLRMSFHLAYELDDFPFVLRMLAVGRISTEGLVTGTVGLDALPAMFATLQQPNDHCKIMITP